MSKYRRIAGTSPKGRHYGVTPPRKRILIVTEGTETEPRYFNHIKKSLNLTSVQVAKRKHNYDAKSIVTHAIEQRREERMGKDDQVWCVYDQDENSAQNLSEANQLAKKAGIHIAFSKPCFELWLFLHYDYSSRPFTSSGELKKEIRRFIPKYDGKNLPLEELFSKTNFAIENAVKLRADHHDNTYTDVDRLVGIMRDQGGLP